MGILVPERPEPQFAPMPRYWRALVVIQAEKKTVINSSAEHYNKTFSLIILTFRVNDKQYIIRMFWISISPPKN